MKLKGVLCGICVVAKQLGLHPEGLMDKRTDDTFAIQGFNAWNSPIYQLKESIFRFFTFSCQNFYLFKSKTVNCKFISIDWSYYFVTFILAVYGIIFVYFWSCFSVQRSTNFKSLKNLKKLKSLKTFYRWQSANDFVRKCDTRSQIVNLDSTEKRRPYISYSKRVRGSLVVTFAAIRLPRFEV